MLLSIDDGCIDEWEVELSQIGEVWYRWLI
jgi:hypothetical protein